MSETWQTGTGLITDYDGEVVEAFFGTDARYNDGNTTILFLKNKPLDGTEPGSDDGLIQESFPMGGTTESSWRTEDGGKTAAGGKKINRSTAMGSLIDRIVTLAGGVEEAAEVFGGGETTKAATWLGFRAHWNEFTEGGKVGADSWSRNKNYPSAILGRSDTTASTSTDALMPKIKAYAETLDYADWIDKCMKLTGVADDATLVARLSDEGWYNELRNG